MTITNLDVLLERIRIYKDFDAQSRRANRLDAAAVTAVVAVPAVVIPADQEGRDARMERLIYDLLHDRFIYGSA